ncbi:E3 ubiquitin-protein ligase Topors [Lucilia cuprina]|uniref:E3 ubiquitin-protein ligase Topors n=1 Tax=Lucilia cuprina TaxID=7375 RepID=A0A0L0BW44_LUCCU|nr:E3 ubiquitin-protein ligase Topors [Lucilia cuprina]KNC23449.1 E3 ubiquitin-protein ligase Topors [Lucilia cuprina]
MDFLDSVMELLNNTPPPPNNVINHTLRNNLDLPLVPSTADMEPNNLSQTANSVDTAADTAVETAPTTQTFGERNLELKLPILSSSSSDSESEEATNPTAGTSAVGEGERAASPPPNCAICLGRCKNKCFTDSCMHQFCFKCLCEWSKVKPECPLCKQTFKSIIHNVKSIDQFEEYHVQPPTVQIAHPPFEMDFQEMRIFGVVHPGHNRNAWNDATHRPFFYGDFSTTSPYSSASTGGATSTGSGALPTASGSSSNRSLAQSIRGLRNQYVYRGELLDLYRQEYPGAIANSGTLSQLWRRYVYDRRLYAMPVADITGRFRESSARFYRDNPSQIHRLMPWINRDIVCLLRQTQHDVTTVLESINSALTIMNILSPAFRRRLQPYLGTKTAHFIHELNNFARSPYDMIGYDRAVQYSPQSNSEEIIIEFTSSDESTDNEQIDVAGDNGAGGNNNNTSSSSSRTRSTTNASTINGGIFEYDVVGSQHRVFNSYFNPFTAINLTIHNRLTSGSANATGSRVNGANNGSGLSDIQDGVSLVIDLRGESDNNETTSTAQATTNSSNYQNGQNTGTSEGDMIMSGPPATVSENIELTSGSSDECEFILERKPPHLRTPEMVSLDSASDSDVVFVDESKPLNKTSFSSSEGEPDDGPCLPKQHTRHNNKIAALVEAKKRNNSANLVKSEQQDLQTEIYNMGASTSAALRLSLQKRGDKSHRSEGGSSSSRLRREKYSLRNNDAQSRAERPVPKRRGKCLDSESSHSSTSSSTTTSSSSSSTTSSTNSSSSSSDEDYVASTSQRRREIGGTRKRSKVRKTKKRKANNRSNRRTTKRDSRKRKKRNNDYGSDSEDEDDDNGHMGKNFALVMAINERQKRQNQKKSSKSQEKDQDVSDGNTWAKRDIGVFEPQMAERAQRVQQSKVTQSSERKRRHKISTQEKKSKEERRNNRKRQKFETETQKSGVNNNIDETSSDESDNINLIQLKTKLTGQDQHKEMNTEALDRNQIAETAVETTTNNENNEQDNMATIITSDLSTIPTSINTVATTDTITETPASTAVEGTTTVATGTETITNDIVESRASQQPNDLLNFFDESNDNSHNYHIDEGQRHNEDDHDLDSTSIYHNEQQILPSSSSLENYHESHHDNVDNVEDNNGLPNNDNVEDDEETLSNAPTNMNLNESNVFADGTSMSTTTTDTILHEAAEQISSAAVNFYNPQQTFNTADFADENSTNSSSSDSSISSTTTSISSSSNSSSSNANSYLNYEH